MCLLKIRARHFVLNPGDRHQLGRRGASILLRPRRRNKVNLGDYERTDVIIVLIFKAEIGQP
jgi:hypothetical protein